MIAVLAFLGFSVEIRYIVAIAPVIIRSVILSLYAKSKFKRVDFSADDKGVPATKKDGMRFTCKCSVRFKAGLRLSLRPSCCKDLALVSVFFDLSSGGEWVQSVCMSFIINGTQASSGDVIARGRRRLRRTFKELQTISYTYNALICGVARVDQPFCWTLYGNHGIELRLSRCRFLAVLNVFLYHLKTPQGLLVVASGMYRETRMQTTIQTLTLLSGSVVGGLVAGMPGILVGCCLSNLYRDLDLLVFIPKGADEKPRYAIRQSACS